MIGGRLGRYVGGKFTSLLAGNLAREVLLRATNALLLTVNSLLRGAKSLLFRILLMHFVTLYVHSNTGGNTRENLY